MDINELIQESYQNSKDHGWHDEERTVGDKLCLMHSELSEALEEFRNGHAVNEVYFVDGKPEGLPIELADVLVRIGDFCGKHNIDLEYALRVKMKYNESRPYRHGHKKL